MEDDKKYNDVDYLNEVMKHRFGFKDEDDDSTDDLYSRYWMGQLPKNNRDLITLASYRRAVARFVKIATRKDIPVVYNVKGHSFVTDKENKVTISAVVKNKEFDAVVGLALHESSHILWTDWEVVRNIMNAYNAKNPWVVPEDMMDNMFRLASVFGETRYEVIEQMLRKAVNSYRNYIEDRRIDDKMIKTIPGYEPYYTALFQKYFGSKIVSAGLKSSFARDLTFKSYNFRIINHINPDSDPNALPGLSDIINLIDVANISRLQNTQDSANVAIEVVRTILNNIPTPSKPEDEDQDSGSGDSEEQGQPQSGEDDNESDFDDFEDGGDLDDTDPNEPQFSNEPSDENETDEDSNESSGEESTDDEEDDTEESDEVEESDSETSDEDGEEDSDDSDTNSGESSEESNESSDEDESSEDESETGSDESEEDESETGSDESDESEVDDDNNSGGSDGGDPDESNEESEDSDDDSSDSEVADEDNEEDEDSEEDNESEDGEESGDESEDEAETEEPEDKPEDLTEEEIKKLEKEIETQSDMLNGEVDKKELDKKDADTLKKIEDAGTTVEHVQGDSKTGLDVYVVRKLTKDIMVEFGLSGYDVVKLENGEYGKVAKPNQVSKDAVTKGIRLGKILAKKLQVRNETKVYKSKRKTFGKIDRRLLHQLGVGTTQIFETINKDQFGSAHVHITIDASGSMSGSKWQNTMVGAVAIAYAATQVENMEVVISFRGTFGRYTSVKRGRGYSTTHEDIPLMVVGYDSRVDKFKKIEQLFPCLVVFGITPEGLCYEAVMVDILKAMSGKEGYFINFSDGYPNMVNDKQPQLKRMSAFEIAKYNVDKIRANGVKVLSFYISSSDETDMTKFKFMYGRDAVRIDVTQLVPLARELNKMFATK